MREGFLNAYRDALIEKGFRVRVLDESALPSDCPLASTYTANWRWDLAMYMAFAEIKVYADGKEVGSAVYDSLGGSANLNKFIKAEAKIDELVDELFRNYSPSADGV